MRMFALAVGEGKVARSVEVAAALEGMDSDVYDGGKGFMRKDDHQFFQPMYIASFGELKNNEAVRGGKDRLGLERRREIDAPETVLPTTCKMERPS